MNVNPLPVTISHLKYMLLAFLLGIPIHLLGQAIPVLPEGKGLAGEYQSDHGIEYNKAVLFYEGFENLLGFERWSHTWANGGSGEILHPEKDIGANGRVYKAIIAFWVDEKFNGRFPEP